MTTWPILSVVTFLPVLGALAIYLTPRRRRGRAAQCALDRAVDHAGHLCGVADPGLALRRGERGFPVRRKGHLARHRHHLSHGRRRHFAAVRDPDHRPDAVLHHRELEIGHDARARIHDGVPAAGNADGRHLLGARPRAVLSVLRRRPDPDVPDHRRLGRPAPGLRVVQVLPLHAARLGPDAARDHGAVLECRHDRHPDPDAHRRAALVADLGVAGVLCLLRGEDADVAGAHLAAGRARRGADRGLGDPGRDPAEDGRLRLPAVLAADVPAGVA